MQISSVRRSASAGSSADACEACAYRRVPSDTAALFEHGRGHVLVDRPTAQPPRGGRVPPVTRPAVEPAAATHVSQHDDSDVTYGEARAWVVDNAPAVAGPVLETYLVGPRDTAERSTWRTGIGWPISRVASLRTDGPGRPSTTSSEAPRDLSPTCPAAAGNSSV